MQQQRRYSATLSVYLEASAFEFDRRLEVGPARAEFASDDPELGLALALAGERPVSQRGGRKELLALLRRMAEPNCGLLPGPACCARTLNGYCGATEAEASRADDGDGEVGFGVSNLIDSITMRGEATTVDDPVATATLVAAAPLMKTTLHPFQARGVAWMAKQEMGRVDRTLHPAWLQLAADSGHFYVHSYTGEVSSRFFPAPTSDTTCGGMLCDEVGLGKSVQILTLILARPPPPGWATAPPLPRSTSTVLPIKASLLVAPASLLPQWRLEVAKHVRDGTLTCATYVGVANAPQPPPPPLPPSKGDDEDGALRKRLRRVVPVDRYAPPIRISRAAGPTTRLEPMAESTADHPASWEVLAASREGLFVADDNSNVAVEQTDIVFCSFETLRGELWLQGKATPGRSGVGDLSASPLASLGFWRIILDEAQVVSNSNSAAAVMVSTLWRRQAWVVTGTPVNAKLAELQGLLSFLDARPFSEPAVFNALVHKPFERRLPDSLPQMRSLLAAHMLRRRKADPVIAMQLNLPPVEYTTIKLSLNEAERAACSAAMSDLRAAYACFVRVTESSANARGAQARLDENRRQRGLDARDYAEGGANSALQQARLQGELNAALTRVRQMLCSPFAINASKAGASRGRGEAAVLTSAVRLPHRTIIERLVAQASRDRDIAAATFLRARAAYYVVHVALAPHVLEQQASSARASAGAASDPLPGSDSEARVEGGAETGSVAVGFDGKAKPHGKASRKRKAPSFDRQLPLAMGALAESHGEVVVLRDLDQMVAQAKEQCASASTDLVVQRVLEVNIRCSRCQRRRAVEGKDGTTRAAEGKDGTAGPTEEDSGAAVTKHGLDGDRLAQVHGNCGRWDCTAAGASMAATVSKPDGAACGDASGDVGSCGDASAIAAPSDPLNARCGREGLHSYTTEQCSKGGEHAYIVAVPRRWVVLRSALRKLFMGKDAPWDADDEREAKAAVAAVARRELHNEDGKAVSSRRQRKNEKATAAAAITAAAASAPAGWERAARRHPTLGALFQSNASRGFEAALEEGLRAVESTSR